MLSFRSLVVVVVALAVGSAHIGSAAEIESRRNKPKNFIMVIPDGFGPASETMARDFVHWQSKTNVLPIDEMMIGQIRTRSSDSYVTDSASSATAYSCGIKTYNAAIGVDDNKQPCGTVLEAAKLQGFKTGLIVTSRITHATPACYGSHVADRDEENRIAEQLIGYSHPLGSVVDILLGGGKCEFVPKGTSGSCRNDDVDLLKYARGKGFQVFDDRKTFDGTLKMPYLGLFTDDHMTYEVDRDKAKEPSLAEMAIKGLDSLYEATKRSNKGFFVMVEASRIDHAGHSNDPVGHLHEILEYNRAMKAMREWIDKHSNSPTTLISTADHECGGGSDYIFSPEHFATASATAGTLASKWKSYSGSDNAGYVKSEIFAKYGITSPTDDEVKRAVELKQSGFESFLNKALQSRLKLNFAHGGHTAVDVTLYGWGVGHEKFAGHRENTEVAGFVAQSLGLDLDAVTKKLRSNSTWIRQQVLPIKGKIEKRALEERDGLMHYH